MCKLERPGFPVRCADMCSVSFSESGSGTGTTPKHTIIIVQVIENVITYWVDQFVLSVIKHAKTIG